MLNVIRLSEICEVFREVLRLEGVLDSGKLRYGSLN